MASADSIRAGKAHVEIGGDMSPLESTLRAVQAKIAAVGAKIRNAGLATLGAGLAITAPLTAAAFAFAEVGDSAQKMADRTGIAVEAVQTLAYAAEQSGASAEELENGLRKMEQFLGDEMTPAKMQLLESLGLSLEELQNMTPDEAFRTFAEAISKIENPSRRTAVAMELFGRAGTRLLPMMISGRAGIEQLEEAWRPFILTAEEAQQAVVFGDKFADLKKMLLQVAVVIGSAVAPILVDLIDLAVLIIKPIFAWVRANKQLFGWLMMLGVALVGVGGFLTTVGVGITAASFAIGGLIIAAKFLAVAALAVVGTFFALLPLMLTIAAVGLAVWGVLELLGMSFMDVVNWVTDLVKEFLVAIPGVQDLMAAFQGIKDAIAIGDWSGAFEIGLLGLQLAFERFKNWLLDIWYGLTFDVLTAWDDLVERFGPTLQPVMRSIVSMFYDMLAQIETAVNSMVDLLPDSIRNTLGLARVDLTSGREGALTAVETALTPTGETRERQQVDTSELDRLSEQLALRLELAAEERANMEYWESWEVGTQAQRAAGAPMMAAMEVGSTLSSFSAAALSQMGASSAMDRTATGVERLVEELIPATERVGDLLEDDEGGVRTN